MNWISVKDRLPENDDDVLVVASDCSMSVGWWDGYWRHDMHPNSILTHWGELPTPPKEG